ncbi:MAG TPA: DUF6285 domain-containing protein [Burkholderiaceae bacterium]|jgi:hypothetical protein|nr:DUF6285 domain-containing protein [Burkholderiaceae bacterium]
MQNTPAPDELLDLVARYLTEVAMPQLPPAAAFHARVAANVLQVVRRQIELAPGQNAAELARLSALGISPEATAAGLPAANEALARAIAQGRIGSDDPALLAHLWQSTFERLAVDQPGYASYRAETSRGG